MIPMYGMRPPTYDEIPAAMGDGFKELDSRLGSDGYERLQAPTNAYSMLGVAPSLPHTNRPPPPPPVKPKPKLKSSNHDDDYLYFSSVMQE